MLASNTLYLVGAAGDFYGVVKVNVLVYNAVARVQVDIAQKLIVGIPGASRYCCVYGGMMIYSSWPVLQHPFETASVFLPWPI